MGICDSANSGKQKQSHKRNNTMPPITADINNSPSGNIPENNQLPAAFQRLSDKSIFVLAIFNLLNFLYLYCMQVIAICQHAHFKEFSKFTQNA